jgi:ATP-dependent Clp protease adaptor protein ClpS
LANVVSANIPRICGLYFTTGGTVAMHNNYINITLSGSPNASSPKIYGVYAAANFALTMYHNTISLSGAHTNTLTPASGVVYFFSADGSIGAIKNNIFQNNITTGTNYVYYQNGTGTVHASTSVDYNFYRVKIAKATTTFAYINGSGYSVTTLNTLPADKLGANSVYVATDQGTDMPQHDTKTATRTRIDVKEPPMFKVIYINDDTTSVEFVISSLIEHFDYAPDSAEQITADIHQSGAAVVAVLPYEVAEQKGIEITVAARGAGYPLQIKLEPNT